MMYLNLTELKKKTTFKIVFKTEVRQYEKINYRLWVFPVYFKVFRNQINFLWISWLSDWRTVLINSLL
jgi:hypothetical protein